MNSTVLAIHRSGTVCVARFQDYLVLTKPRIAILVLLTVGAAFSVTDPDSVLSESLLQVLVGTGLIAASASAWNQWIERETDGRMARTSERPLPARRLQAREVVMFGTLSLLAGVLELAVGAGLVTACLGLLTWVLYVCIYTPLKRITAWNTAVGALAGAMPVAIGWSASGRAFDERFLALFGLLFLWQFPHFMAIAWKYRHEYAAAGLRMVTHNSDGRLAGLLAVLAAVLLVPLSVVPSRSLPAAEAYLLVVTLLGTWQAFAALRFLLWREETTAQALLRATLIYLPGALLGMTFVPLL
jgi:protoheme IX farnesyltransferase